jgi:hypothetical protein
MKVVLPETAADSLKRLAEDAGISVSVTQMS